MIDEMSVPPAVLSFRAMLSKRADKPEAIIPRRLLVSKPVGFDTNSLPCFFNGSQVSDPAVRMRRRRSAAPTFLRGQLGRHSASAVT